MPNTFNVKYEISVGSSNIKAGPDSPLAALEIETSLSTPAHICKITLRGGSDLSAKPDDKIEIKLGYDDSLEKVYTGKTASFQWGLDRVHVEGLSGFRPLTKIRLNMAFESKNAGDIAKDLLQKADVQVGGSDSGEKLPVFSIGDNQPIWTHIRTLAEYCGFDFYADHEDKAVFKKYKARKTHQFKYGEDILAYERHGLSAGVDGVAVFGSSAAEGQGDDGNTWFSSKEVKGTAGKSSGVVLRVIEPAAKTSSLASNIAKNILEARKAKEQGILRVLGNPEIRLGDAISCSKMPKGAHDGEARVILVRHRLNPRDGFITIIGWEKEKS